MPAKWAGVWFCVRDVCREVWHSDISECNPYHPDNRSWNSCLTLILLATNENLSLIVSYTHHSTGVVVFSDNTTTSPTSLTISWTLVGGGTATSDYTISYSNTNTQCFNSSNSSATARTETMYVLTSLQEGTQYSITVTVMLSNGKTEATTTATTMATG